MIVNIHTKSLRRYKEMRLVLEAEIRTENVLIGYLLEEKEKIESLMSRLLV